MNPLLSLSNHRSRLSIAVLWGALICASSLVYAQDRDDLLKQRIFQHEQCANVCQVDLDDRLFKCMPYRKDRQLPVPENCAEVAQEQFDRCMRSCPVDPRVQ